jgi:hypothetical protein
MAREGGGPLDDEVSAQTAPNDREVLNPLACYYPLRDHRLSGRANDEIWYFSYGANMR